jgi:hypothetical protein
MGPLPAPVLILGTTDVLVRTHLESLAAGSGLHLEDGGGSVATAKWVPPAEREAWSRLLSADELWRSLRPSLVRDPRGGSVTLPGISQRLLAMTPQVALAPLGSASSVLARQEPRLDGLLSHRELAPIGGHVEVTYVVRRYLRKVGVWADAAEVRVASRVGSSVTTWIGIAELSAAGLKLRRVGGGAIVAVPR